MAIASKKYAEALVSLQRVLCSNEDMRYATETLAAVNLLLVYEIAGALWSGSQSTFDSQEWLSLPPPEDPDIECKDFTIASEEITRQMIQLPRLIALVRRVRQNPSDVIAGIDALEMAEHLYCSYSSTLAPIIDAALIKRAEWVETLDEDLAEYCPKSLDFEWLNIFEGLVRYSYIRILVLGLCMTLRAVFPFSPVLDAARLEEEEDQYASLITASVQYAERLNPYPLGPLVLWLPLQVAYGTWWRKQRDKGVEGWEHERAVFMKNWCFEKDNAFIKALNGDAVSEDKLQALYRASVEGGPWEEIIHKVG
ncbi:hypothetical protein N0V90_003548 [Kalmusia sp. IMI 367209]|nr:hypothetical protein N0V90_003548 [Kalmusia sp. IMI 367209]